MAEKEEFINNIDYKSNIMNISTSKYIVDKIGKKVINYVEYYYYHKLIFMLVILTIVFISFDITKFHFDFSEDDKNIIWKKGLQFTKECLYGKITQEIPNYPNNHIPILSIIIPVYNANKTIKAAIRSIQNQIMKDYEIILVNDYSIDNSVEVIHELEKEDPRIKLMSNIKNMGALYSRCIGVLSAKGKYIFALDNDDMFFVENILAIIYTIARKDDYDIIGFKSVFATKYNPKVNEMKDGGFYNHQHNLILHQPELGLFPISRFNTFKRNDFTIWAKCIKTDVYRKAVNLMGKERYSNFMSWAEDTSIVFVIFNTASSFKFVRKYGIFHIEAPFCASYTQPDDKKTFGEIFLMDTVYEFSKNTSDKNYAAYQALDSAKRPFFNVEHNKKNSNFLQRVLKKILENDYISEKNKNDVRKRYAQMKFYKDENDEEGD